MSLTKNIKTEYDFIVYAALILVASVLAVGLFMVAYLQNRGMRGTIDFFDLPAWHLRPLSCFWCLPHVFTIRAKKNLRDGKSSIRACSPYRYLLDRS